MIVEKLIEYNKWRRGDETIEQPDPIELGKTIDAAVELMREQQELLKEAKSTSQILHEGLEKILNGVEDCTLLLGLSSINEGTLRKLKQATGD